MKRILFTNWNLMRSFRLGFAVFLFYNAYETQQWFFVVFGLFFLFQALFNMGCNANGCTITYKIKNNEH